MSFTTTIDINDFVARGVEMLLANTILRVPNPNEANSLVTNILAQDPAIEVSPDIAVAPVILVYSSKTPIKEVRNFGRDDLDVAGAKNYSLEFYNLIITRGTNKRDAMQKAQNISKIVRDVYQKNLRMKDPAGSATSNIASTNVVIATPYVLKTDQTNTYAINVICRPEVPIKLT